MSKKLQRDENGKFYPSPEGALHQAISALEAGNDFSWYKFDVEASNDSEATVVATSYDEAGEPDEVYTIRLTIDW